MDGQLEGREIGEGVVGAPANLIVQVVLKDGKVGRVVSV